MEEAAEPTQLPFPASSLGTPGSRRVPLPRQRDMDPGRWGTNSGSAARDGFTGSSTSDGSGNKPATKHRLCLIMYTFLPRL